MDHTGVGAFKESQWGQHRGYEDAKYPIPDEAVLFKKWLVGGNEDGDCYEGGNTYRIGPDSEPTFKLLDDIVLAVRPSITLQKFRVIEKAMKEETYSEHGYYGGHEDFAVKCIELTDLYNLLKGF